MANIKYIPGLDGLRAISVCLVMVSHAGFGHLVPGGLGVTIFFFLSGYLITTLLVDEFERNQSIHIPHFYGRRFLRLFPPLGISLSIAYSLFLFGIIAGGASLWGFLAQVLYCANYYVIFGPGNVPAGTGILWSLAVEEHFYLLYPVCFLLMSRYFTKRKTIAVLALACVLVLSWRMVLVYRYGVSEFRTYYATDTRIDSIIFGCILAIAKNPVNFSGNSERLRVRDYLICGLGLGALLFTLLYRDPRFRESIRYSIQGAALLPMFYYTVSRSRHPLFRWLNLAPLRKLGVYSYSIYLIHYVFLNALSRAGLDLGNNYLTVVEVAAVSIAYAALLNRYIDRPCARLRHKLRD